MPTPASHGLLETLVRTCHARVASQIRRRECFLAIAITLCAACGLLLLGTRYVPVVVIPLALALGAWIATTRLRSTIPDEYRVARQIDEREGLSDELATAYFFRAAETGTFSRRLADRLYEIAARSARSVKPELLFPNELSRSHRFCAYFLGAALLLFALRAGVQPALSFEPPLATLLLHSLFGHQSRPPLASGPDPATIVERPGADDEDASAALPESKSADVADAEDLPDERFDDPERELSELPDVEGLITIPTESIEEPLDELQAQADEGAEGEVGDESADAPIDPDADSWGEDAQSLLDKLKQAFENMLETLDMASVDSSDSESGQEQGSGSTEQASSTGEEGTSGEPDEEGSAEGAEASMEGGEAGEEAGEAASAGTTSGEDSAGEQSSGENASAAGTSDGAKDFAEAEQQEVLGALEELYMERAEKMKGDVTVETRLAEQSANVPYSPQSASHSDSGGAISRDEIPPAYRTYIQNYFETLRRNAE